MIEETRPKVISRILLIEDNPDHGELVVRFLDCSLAGVEVEVAATGEKGLARLGGTEFDLAILDYQLPDGDGLFWLERILKQKPDLPVVMVTGRGSEGVAAEAFRMGAWDYVVKSIDYRDLLVRAVERSLEKARSLRAERRQAAEIVYARNKMEALLGAITDYIVLLNRDFIIQETNQSLAVACDPLWNPIGRHCFREFARREEVCPGCPAQRVFETGLPAWSILPAFRQDGSPREVQISAYPLKDERGQVVQVVEYVKDVTKEKQAKQQLEQARRLSALGEMIAGIAHEIKNPLQNIHLGLDLLREELRKEESLAPILRGIEQGMRTIEAIMEELLDYSRPLHLHRAPWDLRQVVEGTLYGQEETLKNHGIRVVRDWGEKPYEAMVDGVRMGQVFANLFSNACEAMNGGGELRVSLGWQISYNQEWVEVGVSDTGCGISPQNIERVFDPFFTTKGAGVGLGLAIVHRIVSLHQGRIEVHSQVGKGATFMVLLPQKG